MVICITETEIEGEREREAQRHRQREKQAPFREPAAGLDPGSPGSCPRPKAGAKPPSHPGISNIIVLNLAHCMDLNKGAFIPYSSMLFRWTED